MFEGLPKNKPRTRTKLAAHELLVFFGSLLRNFARDAFEKKNFLGWHFLVMKISLVEAHLKVKVFKVVPKCFCHTFEAKLTFSSVLFSNSEHPDIKIFFCFEENFLQSKSTVLSRGYSRSQGVIIALIKVWIFCIFNTEILFLILHQNKIFEDELNCPLFRTGARNIYWSFIFRALFTKSQKPKKKPVKPVCFVYSRWEKNYKANTSDRAHRSVIPQLSPSKFTCQDSAGKVWM